MTRMEVHRGLLGRDDRDVIRQRRVQRLGGSISRRAALDLDADDVPQRMHAGVRPPSDGELVV